MTFAICWYSNIRNLYLATVKTTAKLRSQHHCCFVVSHDTSQMFHTKFYIVS